MQQIGQITAIENNMARIAIRRGTMCKKCGACVSFSSSDTEISLPIPAGMNLSEGDTVKIELPDSGFLLSVFLIYGLPVIVFVCSVVILAQFTSEQYAAFLSLLLCVGSYMILSRLQYTETLKNKISPRIAGVVHDCCD